MSVVPMSKIRICAMKRDRKAILEYLQREGIVSINYEPDGTAGYERMDTGKSKAQYGRRAEAADKALALLDKYIPEKKSIFASLEGKMLANDEQTEHIIANRHWYNTMARSVAADAAKIDACEVEIARCRRNIEGLKPWMKMDIPINTENTEYCKVFIGTMPPEMSKEEITQLINEKEDSTSPDSLVDKYEVTVVSANKDQTCIVAVCHKLYADRLEQALREGGFTKIQFFSHRTPEGKVKKYNRKISQNEALRNETIGKIQKYAKYRETFKILSDYYRIRADKYEVLGTLLQSKKTFLITGCCPSEALGKLTSELESKFALYIETEEFDKDEPMPVLLDNPKALASGEGILSSYGLPSRSDIDPAGIMTICYVVLFGIMLSDAAYGLLVFLVCFLLLKRFPDMGKNLAKSLRLFMYCGLSTMVWGILFGGYFGDAVSVISRTFFGHEVTIPALWFEPLNDPMKMLVVSLSIGLVHLFLGLGIKAYQLARKKDWVAVICDVGAWYFLIIGLILMLMPTEMFKSITGITVVFTQPMVYVSYALAGLGALTIVFMSGRAKKNPALRVALGLYDLYNVTGWLSDLLSYSRLLALGLATGVIANVINQMGSMGGGGVRGAILFVLVFIIGHAMNMAINILGAYVHTSRLQYVEFFGKFYDGTGKEFKPFCDNTRYVIFADKDNSEDKKEDFVS